MARRFSPTGTGAKLPPLLCKRYNVLGALNFMTKKATAVDNGTYIVVMLETVDGEIFTERCRMIMPLKTFL